MWERGATFCYASGFCAIQNVEVPNGKLMCINRVFSKLIIDVKILFIPFGIGFKSVFDLDTDQLSTNRFPSIKVNKIAFR